MQVSQISCLASTMTRFYNAARDMEQVVMFPSLLREVPMGGPANTGSRDLYDHYIKLKTIRITLESSVVPLNDPNMDEDPKVLSPEDMEDMFYYHLSGLFHILTKLTKEANVLTSRYKDLIGVIR
ncbi:mid1-interacting protein 1A-like [Discoglossus pictus]